MSAEITLGELFKAYRKAKNDAFFNKTHFNSLAFAKYEQRLEKNLERLLAKLTDPDQGWCKSTNFIGSYAYLPKSLSLSQVEEKRETEYATLDPLVDWQTRCKQRHAPAEAKFRLIIVPTVDYQIVSALWIMKVGHRFDSLIDRNLSYAHELRRLGKRGPLAEESPSLFVPYMGGYRHWRARGLRRMRDGLASRKSIAAVTMDIKEFYHRVSPKFLVRRQFLHSHGLSLTEFEHRFTERFVQSIDTWYASTPDAAIRKEGALPVGLSASRVISNVLLASFDREVSARLDAIYYGRYADDIFLVVGKPDGVSTGEQFVRWLRKAMQGWLVLDQTPQASGLRLTLPYARDSQIVFAGDKQKIFFLSGEHGFDLVDQIVEKIKELSSEYRQLPELPDSESRMVAKALLASPDARLEADALRKAEAVSIRRLGFSMLLSDVEAYARDLDPSQWTGIRHKFYGLVTRYVLTPTGFFDYFTYLIRVFGLMVATNDLVAASKFLDQFDRVCAVIEKTSTARFDAEKGKFQLARSHYLKGLAQAAAEAASTEGFHFGRRFDKLLTRLSPNRRPPGLAGSKEFATALLRSDLGRRPYYDYWFKVNRKERPQPPLPRDYSVRKALALSKRRQVSVLGEKNVPYWPAIAFPTRPIPLDSLCIIAPDLLQSEGGLEDVLWATRGAKVNPKYRGFSFIGADDDGSLQITVPSDPSGRRVIAVPSYEALESEFEAACSGTPERTLSRYKRITTLINSILRDQSTVQYVPLPECSIPLSWAMGFARKLGQRGISFIAGIENRGTGGKYTNEALVSLSSTFFGKRASICYLQPKLALAHSEQKMCGRLGLSRVAPSAAAGRPIFLHGGLYFAVVICSDLTTIANRAHFQGRVDMLLVIEWNPDTSTFEFLVESTAHDLHVPVVQINNRKYGDSRIRIPFKEWHQRDVVRVKGGDSDFFVVATIDFAALRDFQRNSASLGPYKPLPIGYVMAPERENSTDF